jgi:hypothetical protein
MQAFVHESPRGVKAEKLTQIRAFLREAKNRV